MKAANSFDKSVLLRTLALLRQAEQSLMCVLWPTPENWKALRDFYSPERRFDLATLATAFPGGGPFDNAGATAIARSDSPYPIRSVFRMVANRYRRRFSLPLEVSQLLGFVVNRMLLVLQSPQQPQVGQLIDFRLVTTTAVALLRGHLVGLRELESIQRIEYLGRDVRTPSLSYHELFPASLPRCAGGVRSIR
jgi:hypothetical protein